MNTNVNCGCGPIMKPDRIDAVIVKRANALLRAGADPDNAAGFYTSAPGT